MYGDTYPLSNSKPSTKSTLIPCAADSSTVTIPPSPTVCSALAITAPTRSSSLAEIAATRAKSSSVSTGWATLCRCATSRPTATSMPRLTSTGLAPASIAFMPSWTIAWAITVAVVVPSPTMSLVLIAASLTSWAPMFSDWLRRWISRAMVTPSLVTTGEPVIFSRMTLRPLGPSVDLTASANWSTPASSRSRASAAKRSSLAIGPPGRAGWDVRRDSGNEDGAATDPTGVEIPQRLPRLGERVRLGVQGDLPGLRQDHQLGQLVVRTDDVADDVPLGGEEAERRDVHLAAVPDDAVTPGPAGHREPVLLGTLLGDEVEYDVRAGSVGEVLDRVDLAAVGDDRVVRAELLGELERVGAPADADDPRAG